LENNKLILESNLLELQIIEKKAQLERDFNIQIAPATFDNENQSEIVSVDQ